MSRPLGLSALLVAALGSCGGGTPTAPPPADSAVGRGSRVLSVALSLPENGDFDAAVRLARSAGMQETIFSVHWDEVEPRPGAYEAGPLPLLRAYCVATGLALHLTVTTIDTNVLRLPKDLAGRRFDEAEVAERFRGVLRFVLDQLAGVRVTGLSIGNEVDVHLARDAGRWAEYRAFFASTAPEGRARGLRVGVKATFDGLSRNAPEELVALNRLTDIVLVTYYPLGPALEARDPGEVPGDLGLLVARYPGRPVAILEAGYPSSPVLGGTEARQREFVTRVFEAWDTHAAQIETVSFFSLTDLAPALVEEMQRYYGFPDPRFAAYLGTLGLRTFPGAGTDKEAFPELRRQASRRGWPTSGG
jgi:hypothetical protein